MYQNQEDQLRAVVRDEFPGSLQVAQQAIESDEVRDIMKKLAKYNLGVCMPHMHVRGGSFVDLPSGTVAVEDRPMFLPVAESTEQGALPVAWRWHNEQVEAVGSCFVLRQKCDG